MKRVPNLKADSAVEAEVAAAAGEDTVAVVAIAAAAGATTTAAADAKNLDGNEKGRPLCEGRPFS